MNDTILTLSFTPITLGASIAGISMFLWLFNYFCKLRFAYYINKFCKISPKYARKRTPSQDHKIREN